MPNKIISYRLVNLIKWTHDSKTFSYEMININDTIRILLNKQNINHKNIFVYLGNVHKPYKLKLCNYLDEKIVNLFFHLNNTLFKDINYFLKEKLFTEYSIHIFNYNHINLINDNSSIWEQLKIKFKIKGLDGNKYWTQINI
jgi:hypothetical protein